MNFRTDIQALRGLAVLFVVIYHANLGLSQAGYLGVDIFFVISGYLITGIIKREIEQKTRNGEKKKFNFSGFYFRRAKRLLPAAYVTFIITTVLSVFLLGAGEFKDFAKQLIGAITFTNNIALWLQVGYFDGAAEFKPLLHIWSLSLEEQYYLLLPIALVFIPRRFWGISVSLILISSLVLCFIFVPLKVSASFYLLPTRAWELAIGSLATLITLDNSKKAQRIVTVLFYPSLIAIIILPITPLAKLYPFFFGMKHPGIDAFLVCIATVIIIMRRHLALNTILPARLLAKVGDFSYSLYLVHWPIFAFINNTYVDKPSIKVHEIALVAVLCFGFLLYRYVELPIRRTEIHISKKLVGVIITISLILAITPFIITFYSTSAIDYAQIRRGNTGFSDTCDFTENFTLKIECRNSDKPALLVWGDSYAMHLVPGIIATTDAGIVQATRSVCGPFINLAPIDNTSYNRSWAERCLDFNQSVFEYLKITPSIKVVVMSSPFNQFLINSNGDKRLWRSLKKINGSYIEGNSNALEAFDAMQTTLEKLHAIGKRVVIVAPPPASGFDIGLCLERKATNKLNLGTNSDCFVHIDDYHKIQSSVLDFLKRIEYELNTPVIYFDDFLCDKTACITTLDDVFVYRDGGHLSCDGSRAIAKKMNLGKLLQIVAN